MKNLTTTPLGGDEYDGSNTDDEQKLYMLEQAVDGLSHKAENWLDIGEGKEVNLTNKCPRSKLQQQCIKYLDPMERKAYEIVIENGKLFYKQSGEILDTTLDPHCSENNCLKTTVVLAAMGCHGSVKSLS